MEDDMLGFCSGFLEVLVHFSIFLMWLLAGSIFININSKNTLKVQKLFRKYSLCFQIIIYLTFLTPSLTCRLIQKFVKNITYFIMAYFINTSSSRMN